MGGFNIVNSVSALNGQYPPDFNNAVLSRALNRIASGLRINTGADGTDGASGAAGFQTADAINIGAATQPRGALTDESKISDANMAGEIAGATIGRILAQTGIAAQAHSNVNIQAVLGLL